MDEEDECGAAYALPASELSLANRRREETSLTFIEKNSPVANGCSMGSYCWLKRRHVALRAGSCLLSD